MATSPFLLLGPPAYEAGYGTFERYVGGSNSRLWHPQFVVAASLAADLDVWLHFLALAAPSNTLKMQLIAAANASTGNAKVNLAWESGTPPFNFDTLSLDAEGTTTIAWSSEADNFKSTKITMDAGTQPSAGDIVVCQLRFETASWSLAQKSYWSAFLIDE